MYFGIVLPRFSKYLYYFSKRGIGLVRPILKFHDNLIPVPGIIGMIQRDKNIGVHSKIRRSNKSKGLLHIYNTYKSGFKTFQDLGNLPFEFSPIPSGIDINLYRI